MAKKTVSLKNAKIYARDYINYLSREHKLPIQSAYLFGSFAKGKKHSWSDIDVCVISEKFRQIDPLIYLWTKRRPIDIERGIEPFGIQPQDFVEENPIAHEVRKYGLVL